MDYRGAPKIARGDITGRQMAEQRNVKASNETAKKATMNALISGEAVVAVKVPSGRTFLVPREAHDAIVSTVEEMNARGGSR